MPIADLVGVQLDVQLLMKLTLSAAVLLLGSWAFHFYRNDKKRLLCCNNNGTCQKCNATLGLPDDVDGELKEDVEERSTDDVNGEAVFNLVDHSLKDDAVAPPLSTADVSCGLSLKLPQPAAEAAATGRLSPCFLQRLEGSVGRELRQDSERQGARCSFLSKAQIKVEAASLRSDGDQVVRGKIYDYYVESSSRSVTESTESGGESVSFTNTIVMRDLVPAQSCDQDLCTPPGKAKPRPPARPPARPALRRNQSYESAAEQSQLSVHPQTSTHATPLTSSARSVHPKICPSMERANVQESETDAKPLFSRLQLSDGADLESLKSKIDLGNCLETLQTAKRAEHAFLQLAALSVMSDNYVQVLRDPGLYGRLLAGEREHIRTLRSKGRSYVMAADMDPQDGDGTQPSSAVHFYDDDKDQWRRLCQIPAEVVSRACAVCTLDNYLYLALGCERTASELTPSKRVFCFNPLTSIWREISAMQRARPRCRLAAVDGSVFAIGGECLSSVERYDPRSDRWVFVAPLPNDTFAVAHHVAVCGGDVFVCGGTLRRLLLRYSPRADRWTASVMASTGRTADMVAVGRFLYRFHVNPLLGISVYRYHTVARLWYECSSKRVPRCPGFQCVARYASVFCVNRQLTARFEADDVFPAFADEDLSVLSAAKGKLFPFVLSLPDKKPLQTSV